MFLLKLVSKVDGVVGGGWVERVKRLAKIRKNSSDNFFFTCQGRLRKWHVKKIYDCLVKIVLLMISALSTKYRSNV